MARVSKDTTPETDIAVANDAPAAAAPTPKFKAPRLGEQIAVVAAPGRLLANLEFGGHYSEVVVGPATVTLRILRLLEDGDLIRHPL
ncbi:hypothetical protein N6G05_13705 [Cupriavidus gilardii]|uniref:hypothetical protein n=1 Tax=Cupriavidus gilardii TaxID=82541 RepID=UPI0021BF1DE0|nr:hypothetical protein [Cupriavidus gilardii]MCT9014616.1 hypothetical protein [Cupriavidus gilardii]MCT9054336.1 hypothetical protein [Cupriavidus gilardii]